MTDMPKYAEAIERNGRVGIWIDGRTALAVIGTVVALRIIDAIIAVIPS